MTVLETLEQTLGYINNPSQESLQMSMADVHHEGLFSLVVNGTEFGKLTRIFISTVKLKPFSVQLHTHRYPIKLTTLSGQFRHHVASLYCDSNFPRISRFTYKSPLNGGNGLNYEEDVNIAIDDYIIPIGTVIHMDENDIHTVSCSKGSMWIVEEQGFKRDYSEVYGVPFITTNLYKQPSMFQINDNVQLVRKTLNELINSYKSL